MTDRPPSPPTPTASGIAHDPGLEDRIVATTAQLAAAVEESLGVRLNDGTLEDLLLELDRCGYVEWVTVTRAGDYLWDLSETPEELGEAIAEALVAQARAWLEAGSD